MAPIRGTLPPLNNTRQSLSPPRPETTEDLSSSYQPPQFLPPDMEIIEAEPSRNTNSPPVFHDFLLSSTSNMAASSSDYQDPDSGPSLSGTKRSSSDFTSPSFSHNHNRPLDPPPKTHTDPNLNPNQNSYLNSNHQANLNPNQNPNLNSNQPNLNLAHNANSNPNHNLNQVLDRYPNLIPAHNPTLGSAHNPNSNPNHNLNQVLDRYPNLIPAHNPTLGSAHNPNLNPNQTFNPNSGHHPNLNPANNQNFPKQNSHLNSGHYSNLNLARTSNLNPSQNANLNTDPYNYMNPSCNPNLNPNQNSYLNRDHELNLNTAHNLSSNRNQNTNLNPDHYTSLNSAHNPNLNHTQNPNLNHYQCPSLNPVHNPNTNRNPNLNPENHPSLNHAHNPNLNQSLNPIPNPHPYFHTNQGIQRDTTSFLSLSSNPVHNSNPPKINARMYSRLPPPPPRRVPAIVEKMSRNCEEIRSAVLALEPAVVPDDSAFPGATKVVLKKAKKPQGSGSTSNGGPSTFLGRQMTILYGTNTQVYENVHPTKVKQIMGYAASSGTSVPTSQVSSSTNTQVNSTKLLAKSAQIPGTELRLSSGSSGVIDIEDLCSPKEASPGNTSSKEPDVQPSQNEMDNDQNGNQHVQPLQTEMGNNQNVQPLQTETDNGQNVDQNVQHSQTETVSDNGQNGNQTKGNEADAPKE